MQEDKVPVFQAFDTLTLILPVLAGALETMTVHPERMRAAISADMLATDLADYLVRKGVPFREAHAAAGRAVRRAAERGTRLENLSMDEWQACGPFEADVYRVFDPMGSTQRRNATGGALLDAVRKQIQNAKGRMQNRNTQSGM